MTETALCCDDLERYGLMAVAGELALMTRWAVGAFAAAPALFRWL